MPLSLLWHFLFYYTLMAFLLSMSIVSVACRALNHETDAAVDQNKEELFKKLSPKQQDSETQAQSTKDSKDIFEPKLEHETGPIGKYVSVPVSFSDKEVEQRGSSDANMSTKQTRRLLVHIQQPTLTDLQDLAKILSRLNDKTILMPSSNLESSGKQLITLSSRASAEITKTATV